MLNRAIRVVIIDDHAIFAEGLRVLLESSGDRSIEVVAIELQAVRAVATVSRHDPDLAIVDVRMPPPGGVAAIAAIKRHHPHVRVVALSGVDELCQAEAALAAGADGFISKAARLDEMLKPMEAVVSGWTVVPKPLLDHLLQRAARRPTSTLVTSMAPERQRLWKLIAEGRETTEIAAALFVSERTAKRQVSSLLKAIGATNRLEAAARAGQVGLLDAEDPDEPGDR